MTQDALSVVQILFSSIWEFFNSWYIPGTRVTIAGLFLFFLFAFIVIKFVRRVFISGGEED